MSAAEALKAARAAGIKLGFDGDDLVLEAAVRPAPAVIDLLSRHKAEVLAMLAAIEHERNESKLLATRLSPKKITQATQGEPGFEESCAARRGRVEEIDGVLLHFCVECGRFGPYGDGVRLRAGQLGRWYCHKHRPQEHDEAKA